MTRSKSGLWKIKQKGSMNDLVPGKNKHNFSPREKEKFSHVENKNGTYSWRRRFSQSLSVLLPFLIEGAGGMGESLTGT